jgi:hypothetical protein
MEQEVMDEINLRTECLVEMYQVVGVNHQGKPDQNEVNQIQ